MKRGSMRSWLCVSALGTCLLAADPVDGVAQDGATPKRDNEVTVAGLRPGKDLLATAEKQFRGKHLFVEESERSAVWKDQCTGRFVRVEFGAKRVIQSVTVSSLGEQMGDCTSKRWPLAADKLKTGKGLALNQSLERVSELYGEPESRSPSTQTGRELELLVYAFDWAGSDVPQVMEVWCDRATGRVVEITLAFPSP